MRQSTTGRVSDSYGEMVRWEPATPRLRVLRLLVSWVVAAASVAIAAWIVPGAIPRADGGGVRGRRPDRHSERASAAYPGGAQASVHAGRRLLLVLAADAFVLQVAGDVLSTMSVGSFGDALLAALVMSAVSLVLQVIIGANDEDEYGLRVTRRIARRQGAIAPTDVPGIIYLEIDGLALPVLRDAMRDGSVPFMASLIADHGHRLAEWETDFIMTGASQAGILLGSNEDIPPSGGWRRRPAG